MNLYRYKAIGYEGTLQKGILRVSSSQELKAHLQESGLSLITYSKEISFHFFQRVKSQALIDLCFHLEQFEKAGIPLRESLNELFESQKTPKLKSTLREVIRDVEGGWLLSQALAKHPCIFDLVFTGLITAGEKTGNLSFTFHQLLLHLKWKNEVQAQIFKALVYPSIMVIILFTVIFSLMISLVPELVIFIKNFSRELPSSTRILIALSGFLSKHLLYLFLFFLSLTCILLSVFKLHPKGPTWKEKVVEVIPFIGPLRQRMALARFCHIFAILFGNGIDILLALQTARKSIPPGHMNQALEKVEIFVREGHSLSQAFYKTGFFPSLIVRMIKIGEQTSSLQKTLQHVKDYFDNSLKHHIDHMVGLIEPLMILSVGSILGWIIVSIFLPLYETLTILDY